MRYPTNGMSPASNGSHGELFFLVRKRTESGVWELSLDAPCVKYDYETIFEQDSNFQQDAGLWTRPSPRLSLVMFVDERRNALSDAGDRQCRLKPRMAVECFSFRKVDLNDRFYRRCCLTPGMTN